MKTSAGRSFYYKMSTYSIKKEDLNLIFKKINELYPLFLSSIFNKVDGDSFISQMEEFVTSIFEEISSLGENNGGGIPYSVKKTLEKGIEDSVLKNLNTRNFINRYKKYRFFVFNRKEKISMLNDLSYYYGKEKLDDVMPIFYSKIENIKDEKLISNLYSEISSLKTIVVKSLLEDEKIQEALKDDIDKEESSRFVSKEELFAEGIEDYPRETLQMLSKIRLLAKDKKSLNF